jgi:hypothetical protein
MKKNKKTRWPDYDLIDLKDVVTFGTTLFIRKDHKALRILFPAGQCFTFMPEDEFPTGLTAEQII